MAPTNSSHKLEPASLDRASLDPGHEGSFDQAGNAAAANIEPPNAKTKDAEPSASDPAGSARPRTPSASQASNNDLANGDRDRSAQMRSPGHDSEPMARLADFLFETATLKRTPRTGYQFLGRGHENVAEHSFGATAVAFVLGRMAEGADISKLMAMALFHDLAEARTGDLNYVNKRYVAADEDAAFRDATSGLPFESELAGIWAEWRLGESLEARLAKDADQLDMILELKRLASHGWSQAADWLFYAIKRLATEPGKLLGERIMARGPDDWWFERKDELWVNPKSPSLPERKREPARHSKAAPRACGELGEDSENELELDSESGPSLETAQMKEGSR